MQDKVTSGNIAQCNRLTLHLGPQGARLLNGGLAPLAPLRTVLGLRLSGPLWPQRRRWWCLYFGRQNRRCSCCFSVLSESTCLCAVGWSTCCVKPSVKKYAEKNYLCTWTTLSACLITHSPTNQSQWTYFLCCSY